MRFGYKSYKACVRGDGLPCERNMYYKKRKMGLFYLLCFTVTVADACAVFPEASVASYVIV